MAEYTWPDGEQGSWNGWHTLTPVLRFANFYDAEPGSSFGPRYIQDFQILLVQAGVGHATIAGHFYDIVAGDLLFYGPNELHQITSSTEAPLKLIGLHFVFRQEDLARVDPITPDGVRIETAPFSHEAPINPLHPSPAPKISPRVASNIGQTCEQLVLSFLADPLGKAMEKRGLLLVLFELWHDAMAQSPGISSLPIIYRQAIDKAQSDILANLKHPPAIESFARESRLSERYFGRLFKQRTGYSVKEYVLHQRLLQAQRLLIDGHLNVGEVANATGFSDPHYFSRYFAKKFGMPPSSIRTRRGRQLG